MLGEPALLSLSHGQPRAHGAEHQVKPRVTFSLAVQTKLPHPVPVKLLFFEAAYGTLHLCLLNSILLFSTWNGNGEDLLISSDSTSTEVPSPEGPQPPRGDRVQRSRPLRTRKGPALPPACPTPEHERPLFLPKSHQEGGKAPCFQNEGHMCKLLSLTQPLLEASTAFLPRNVFHFFNVNTNQIYYIPPTVPGWGLRKLCFLGTKDTCA